MQYARGDRESRSFLLRIQVGPAWLYTPNCRLFGGGVPGLELSPKRSSGSLRSSGQERSRAGTLARYGPIQWHPCVMLYHGSCFSSEEKSK